MKRLIYLVCFLPLLGCGDVHYHAATLAPSVETKIVKVEEAVPEIPAPPKAKIVIPVFSQDSYRQPILTPNEKTLIDDLTNLSSEADAWKAGVETYNRWAKAHNSRLPLAAPQSITVN